MKIKLLAVAGVLLLSGCDGLTPDYGNKALVNANYEYEIDTWGSNSEVYEFTPKSNRSKTCVFVMLDNGRAMGLQCFNKRKGQDDSLDISAQLP